MTSRDCGKLVSCGILCLVSLLFLALPIHAGTLFMDNTIQHGGLTRSYHYFVPSNLPGSAVPLVVALHGGTGSADDLLDGPAGEWLDLAEADKFIVALPNGDGNNWNDCRADADEITGTADDTGFVEALIDELSTSYNIDQDRVYASGASNGGMMSYRLARELSHRIAAVGAVIANKPATDDCTGPVEPVSVLIMNGTADPLMPHDGGCIQGLSGGGECRGLVHSTAETVDFWVSFLNANTSPTVENLPDLDTRDGSTVSVSTYAGGDEGTEVVHYSVDGGGHNYPSIAHQQGFLARILVGRQNHDIESVHEIWDFLKTKTR